MARRHQDLRLGPDLLRPHEAVPHSELSVRVDRQDVRADVRFARHLHDTVARPIRREYHVDRQGALRRPVDVHAAGWVRCDYSTKIRTDSCRDDALETFKELFLGACPKYLAVNPPPYEDPSALQEYIAHPPQDAVHHQLDLFISDVKAIRGVTSVRNLLKLYTSIDAGKLAAFMNAADAEVQDAEEAVLQQLMALKAASRTYARQGDGSLLDGERIVTNNLDFTMEGVSAGPSPPLSELTSAGNGACGGDNVSPTVRGLLHPQCGAQSQGAELDSSGAFAHVQSWEGGAVPATATTRPGGRWCFWSQSGRLAAQASQSCCAVGVDRCG